MEATEDGAADPDGHCPEDMEATADGPRPPAAGLHRPAASLSNPAAAEERVARAATLPAARPLRLVTTTEDMDMEDMDSDIARAHMMVTTTGWEEIRDPPCGRHPAAALHHQVPVESQASLAEESLERAARELRSCLMEEYLFV